MSISENIRFYWAGNNEIQERFLENEDGKSWLLWSYPWFIWKAGIFLSLLRCIKQGITSSFLGNSWFSRASSLGIILKDFLTYHQKLYGGSLTGASDCHIYTFAYAQKILVQKVPVAHFLYTIKFFETTGTMMELTIFMSRKGWPVHTPICKQNSFQSKSVRPKASTGIR